MLSIKKNILEIGCTNGFGNGIVVQEVENLMAVDFDPLFIQDAKKNIDPHWRYGCIINDPIKERIPGKYDAAHSLDIIEHIPKEGEDAFFKKSFTPLQNIGVLIIGASTHQSQQYSVVLSKEGHFNVKDHTTIKDLLSQYFQNVFLFLINEKVYTRDFILWHIISLLSVATKKSNHGLEK